MDNKEIITIIWYVEKKRKLQIQCLNVNDITGDRLFWKQLVFYSLKRTVSESSKITLIEHIEIENKLESDSVTSLKGFRIII